MIELDDLSIRSGAFSLTNVNLSIPAGAYAVLMGGTGQGKTTILEAICGLRTVTSGRVILGGVDVTRCEAGRSRRRLRAAGPGPVSDDDRPRASGIRPPRAPRAAANHERPRRRAGPRAGHRAAAWRGASAASAAARRSASPSAGPSRFARACCCSTSRSTPSTKPRATASASCCDRCKSKAA